MTSQPAPWRRLVSLAVAAAVGLLGLTAVTVGPASPAAAADLSAFDPGYLVSEQNFWDSTVMGAADIQAFLNARGATCRPNASDGTPCLKDFRQDTTTRAADDRCTGGYAGAASESAATIIAKVAQACGVSPRVILVTLQKEQGLVTTTTPTQGRYRSAMGYGCPDTAACDAKYYGFQNQVFQAAWQFRSYALTPTRWTHRAGLVNNVRFHPNAACGTSPVLIRNQATAGLYNYTPYQPNSASLAAGYGTGDACSSYGNRNFVSYWTDWFGAPTGVPPIGNVDSITLSNTGFTVSGWALDLDTSASIAVHVYVDGVGVAITANQTRADVAAVYPNRGAEHGFTFTSAQDPGSHAICVYAINADPGTNAVLTCQTIVVPDAAPFGSVDTVSTTSSSITVGGWSIDPDSWASTEVHIYMDGVGVATVANRSRPDIGAMFGRGDQHGFTHTLPASLGHHELCVYAINTARGPHTLLWCGGVDVQDTTAPPFGVLDTVSVMGPSVSFAGWTVDPDTTEPTEVHVYIDGVGTAIRADGMRADVAAVFGRGDKHGFSWSTTLAPGPHDACVHAINTQGTPHTLLGCRSFTVTDAAPIGVVDAVTASPGSVSVAGWALDPDTTDPVQAHIYIDGAGVALLADQPRADVAAVFGRGDLHGFSYTTPLPAGDHSICVFAIDSKLTTNTMLTCRTFSVP